jgi:2-desacetyl-2-hydroxyethyl bacteriochlorophyllide A dehydrogenase
MPSGSKTFQALYPVITSPLSIVWQNETLAAEALEPPDVIVEAEASFISAGTELANYQGRDPDNYTPGSWNAYPFRPGYALVGRVLAAGSAATFQPGDRIFCYGRHASHQVYRVQPASNPWAAAFPLPASLPAAQAAALRLALIAFTAPQISSISPGDTVAVFGLGLVGNLAAQLYRLAGARVIGLDPSSTRCALAKRCGIDVVIDTAPHNQLEAVHALTGGKGAEITVDAVGDGRVVHVALKAAANFGQVMLLGTPRTPQTDDVTALLREIHLRWLTVRGALECAIPTLSGHGIRFSTESNFARLVAWASAGQLQIAPLISHTIQPQELDSAYQRLIREPETTWGVAIDWTRQG